MEFDQLIETLREEDASASRRWESDDAKRLRDASRYTPAQLAECAKFLRNVEKGKEPAHRLKEALTTSDFPLMFADILDRQLLGYYQEVQPTWQAYARRSVVPDLRNVKRFAVDGAEKELEGLDELEEYPKRKLKESKDEFKVGKFGARLDISWEAGINDDLGAFLRTPERLARAARRTESKFATRLWIDEKGPHASLYKAEFNNIVKDGAAKQPPLSIEALQTAFTLLSSFVDEDGEPIVIDHVTLVIPPALEVVANNILHATEIRTVVNGGVEGQELQVANWMNNRLNLQVEPYIPHIASKENGNTTWAMFATPSTGRPALEMGFLRGEEDPALYERIPNARRVGGGGEANESFEDDSRAWKVRHVLGGTRLTTTGGFRATVASNGSGK
jgi:hypothetical protein